MHEAGMKHHVRRMDWWQTDTGVISSSMGKIPLMGKTHRNRPPPPDSRPMYGLAYDFCVSIFFQTKKPKSKNQTLNYFQPNTFLRLLFDKTCSRFVVHQTTRKMFFRKVIIMYQRKTFKKHKKIFGTTKRMGARCEAYTWGMRKQ